MNNVLLFDRLVAHHGEQGLVGLHHEWVKPDNIATLRDVVADSLIRATQASQRMEADLPKRMTRRHQMRLNHIIQDVAYMAAQTQRLLDLLAE